MKFSFQTGLLTVLLGLVLVTAVSLGVNGYWNSRAADRDLSFKVLDQSSLVIDQKIRGLLLNANRQATFTQQRFRTRELKVDDPVRLVSYFRTILDSFPDLTGVFIGFEADGGSVGLSRRDNGRLLAWELKKNPATGKLEIREYAPDDYPTRASRVDENGDFADTRRRPWYIEAKAAGRQVWSRVYPFFMFRGVETVPGITCAAPLYGEDGKLVGVLAVDIRLDKLCDFLGTLQVFETGFPFIVEVHPNGARHVIAHPDKNILLRDAPPGGISDKELMAPEEVSDRRVPAFMAKVPEHVSGLTNPGSTPVHFRDGDTPYFGAYRVMEEPSLPFWVLCTVIPEKEVLAGALSAARVAVAIGAAILLCAALISVLAAGRFSRALVRLARETKAVGRFELAPGKPVPSLLTEVDQLARATEQMKTNLRSFGKYVPTDLVRELLATGAEARLGGESRDLTIFFCDLASFTTFSEGRTPQQVVEQLGDYFHALTEEVTATGGTVDKFIGDAVMAFWGAPVAMPDHAAAACRCAVRCQKRLAALRESWEKQGKPPLFARIGLNTGPVVVGNIGSASRFNYTVIGDAVNLASRLEGLNKFYGTGICLSEDTFREAGDAVVVRPVDWVSVKGKTAPVLVYELLGLPGEVPAETKRLADLHGHGLECYRRRDWAAAAAAFEEILRARPDDGPAAEMLRRCREYERQPPGPDWDGTHRMDHK
jgi:adenylate cyclase